MPFGGNGLESADRLLDPGVGTANGSKNIFSNRKITANAVRTYGRSV